MATDATSATGCTSRTIAAASSWCCRRARSARPTTSAATTSGRTSTSSNLLCALVDEAFAADATLAARFPDAPPARARQRRELITFVRDRAGHDRRYAIDASKINRELGYVPAESFETGIRKTLDWFLANEPWWRAILDGSYRS